MKRQKYSVRFSDGSIVDFTVDDYGDIFADIAEHVWKHKMSDCFMTVEDYEEFFKDELAADGDYYNPDYEFVDASPHRVPFPIYLCSTEFEIGEGVDVGE